MAQIDVSALLSDPDFTDNIQVLTRVPAIDNFGENTITESTLNTIGSVQPATGKALSRIPEAAREANMSNFWFKGEIVSFAPGLYTSVLVFRGHRFQVKNIFDWSNWGAGWTEGLCVAEVPAP
jgi:hypothetical protein